MCLSVCFFFHLQDTPWDPLVSPATTHHLLANIRSSLSVIKKKIVPFLILESWPNNKACDYALDHGCLSVYLHSLSVELVGGSAEIHLNNSLETGR